MRPTYDVVVIGAGPAGSVAARTTAEAGLSTLLLEKRQEIGSPVRCGEAVGRETTELFIPANPQWIAADIDAFSVHNPQGDCVILPPEEHTWVLERKLFDRELARLAAIAGAEVVVKARAAGMTRDPRNDYWDVQVVVQGRPMTARAKVVIGADGTESQSTRWAGLKPVPRFKDYYIGAQYLMTGVGVDPRLCQYHLGWSMCPGGYGWVFPKGNDQANVGLVMWVDPKGTKTAIDYLDEFVAKRFPNRSILAQVVGGIPITDVLSPMVADGYLAVGDAAHQSDPLTAGGIGNGMYGGLFAAQVAAEGIKKGDVTACFFHTYEQMWDAKFGQTYRRLYRMRQAILKAPEDKISQIIAHAARVDTQKMSLLDIAKIVFRSYPQLLLDVVPYLLRN